MKPKGRHHENRLGFLSMMRADRLTYDDAIQFTERQELLLKKD
jgi:hypothetical protein